MERLPADLEVGSKSFSEFHRRLGMGRDRPGASAILSGADQVQSLAEVAGAQAFLDFKLLSQILTPQERKEAAYFAFEDVNDTPAEAFPRRTLNLESTEQISNEQERPAPPRGYHLIP